MSIIYLSKVSKSEWSLNWEQGSKYKFKSELPKKSWEIFEYKVKVFLP